MQIRSLQSSLASAESCRTAAQLDAKHATESADSELRALQQEIEVLKSTAGSDKNRALQDLKASSQAGPAWMSPQLPAPSSRQKSMIIQSRICAGTSVQGPQRGSGALFCSPSRAHTSSGKGGGSLARRDANWRSSTTIAQCIDLPEIGSREGATSHNGRTSADYDSQLISHGGIIMERIRE